jgi:hypothetical protein
MADNAADNAHELFNDYKNAYGEKYRPERLESYRKEAEDAIKIGNEIEAYLAKPVQEPVAWGYDMINHYLRNNLDDDDYDKYVEALNSIGSEPQSREPMSEDEIESLRQAPDHWSTGEFDLVFDELSFARAIEAHHGIK